MIAIGPDDFGELLAGAARDGQALPRRAAAGEPARAPGLLGVWNRNFLGAADHAVLPYDQYLLALPRLPAAADHGEQRQERDAATAQPVDYARPAPSFWGEPGTNGQHSFYQLLHQGTTIIACDFIVVARPVDDVGDHQDLLVANCLAQSAVLAFGRSAEEVAADGTPPHLVPHKVMPGNRPNACWSRSR